MGMLKQAKVLELSWIKCRTADDCIYENTLKHQTST